MKSSHSITKKMLAMLVCIAMLVTCLPAMVLQANAVGDTRVVDNHTLDQWQNYFGELAANPNNVQLSTEYAGGVWTDKSVFSAGSIPSQLTTPKYNNNSFAITDKGDNFLVALSAIASNKEIVGYSTIPTDTVFVLDLSSSMQTNDDQNGSAVDELVDATNEAIASLLKLNKNNRISVVLYAGNTSGEFNNNPGATTVILPLDTYSAATAGTYLESVDVGRNPDYGVKVADGVSGTSGAVSGNMNTARGTFMQDGIYEATNVLLNVDDTKVETGVQAGTGRLPIMVLMTDGEPTMANWDFDGTGNDLGTSNVHLRFTGQDYNHRDTIAWLTQLTAAYAKREVSRHYQTDALFYTLAFGEESTNREEAKSVMDPTKTSAALNGFWETFLNGDPVTVFTYTENRQTRYYRTTNTAGLTAADKLYVDKPFAVSDTAGSTAAAMSAAFAEIVQEIVIQSKYYPTYVEKDHDHDGYLTFVDKIGEHMEVTDIKGIIIGDRLFSGAAIAKALEDGSFGSIADPNSMGDNLVWSVKERIGIADTQVAQALLQNAYEHGQLSYTSATEFSHYIGWYSDAEGNYVDFWHEGMTAAQKPAAATHVIKSYGFLGETDAVHGISNTDMMYMSVRIATEIATGKTTVTWQIPASLVPTVTYEVAVEVDSNGRITRLTDLDLAEDSAKTPIRLLYEVALRSDVHDWNVTQKVTPNINGDYVFYTNQWNRDPETTTENTYSHFEPSVENERYYYTQDTQVLVKSGTDTYTPYTGSKPTGAGYWHVLQVFERLANGTLRIHTHYEPISEEAMDSVKSSDSGWVIPKGVVHRYYDYEITNKVDDSGNRANFTGTMEHSDHPFIVWDAVAGHYYTYSTQGNNGMLTMIPATGIKLTKELAAGYTNTGSFTFKITGDISTAQLVRLDADGKEASREELPVSGEFTLKAGQTVYIVGLKAEAYTVEEVIPAGADYQVANVTVDNAGVGTAANVTLTAQDITDVRFTNDEINYADLYITKEVEHSQDGMSVPSSVLAQEFTVLVDFGTVRGTFALEQTGKADSTITVENDGTNELTLKHGETIAIRNLPEGAAIAVTELNVDAHFAASYSSRNHSGHTPDADGNVIITVDHDNDTHDAATVVVTNTYTPASVGLDLNVNITKDFGVEQLLTAPVTFNFELQAYNGSWQTVKTGSVTYESGTPVGAQQQITDIALTGLNFTKPGNYDYRILEQPGDIPGLAYDPAVYTFTVKVTDNGGQLAAQIVDHAGAPVSGNSYDVRFENIYHAAPVIVDVVKAVNNGASPAGFAFLVSKTDASFNSIGNPQTELTDSTGRIRFAGNYTANDYYYTIREQIPAGATLVADGAYAGTYFLNGWYWDPTVYYVHISVIEESGNVTAVVKSGTDPLDLSGTSNEVVLNFKNEYQPTEAKLDLDFIPTVTKTLVGRELTAADNFTFHIYSDGDRSNLLSTGTVGDLISDDVYQVDFDEELVFGKAGSYNFDVLEVNGGEHIDGVTYDPTIYDLVVEVVDNNGTLEASYYFEDVVGQTANFTNVYHMENKDLVLSGTKKLSGRPMLDGEFTFVLTQVTDETGTAALENGLVLEAENNADDNHDGNAGFTFSAITYTAADVGSTYYYRIAEKHAGKKILGVQYSDSQYVVKVTVSDNGDGTLKLDQQLFGGDEIKFENVYKPANGEAELHGYKELSGRELADGEFTFTITQTKGDFETVVKSDFPKVTNDAEGKMSFGVLNYTKKGTYYYVIREDVSQPKDGIVYDRTEYLVTVQVTDSHTGKLETAVSIEKKTVVEESGAPVEMIQPVSSIIFYNSYEAPEPPVTEPPATEPPVTEPPATEPPATEPPATEPPATEPPATEPPVTEPPATEPPATEPPATKPPAVTPETGDSFQTGVFIGLMVLSSFGLAVIMICKKRDEKKQKA